MGSATKCWVTTWRAFRRSTCEAFWDTLWLAWLRHSRGQLLARAMPLMPRMCGCSWSSFIGV